MSTYVFLEAIERDGYYPPRLLLKGKRILTRLCESIEHFKPQSLEELLVLTHRATKQFNELRLDLEAAGSDLDSPARDTVMDDMAAIAKACSSARVVVARRAADGRAAQSTATL